MGFNSGFKGLIPVEIRSFFRSVMDRNVSQTVLLTPTNFDVCIEVPAFPGSFIYRVIVILRKKTAMSNADPALLLANNSQSKYSDTSANE